MKNYVDDVLERHECRESYKQIIAEILLHYTVYKLQERYLQLNDPNLEIIDYPQKCFPFRVVAENSNVSPWDLTYIVFLLTIKDREHLGIFDLCKRLRFNVATVGIETAIDQCCLSSIMSEVSCEEKYKFSIHRNVVESIKTSQRMPKYLPMINEAVYLINEKIIDYLQDFHHQEEVFKTVCPMSFVNKMIYHRLPYYEDVKYNIDTLIEARDNIRKLFARLSEAIF